MTSTEPRSPAATELVVDYLGALVRGDTERARVLLTDDFTFRGPMLTTTGKDAFLAEAIGAYEFVRGFEIVRQWHDGDEVCSIYELDVASPAAEATMLMCEWSSIRGEQLASSVLIFDTSVHDTLMPDGHSH